MIALANAATLYRPENAKVRPQKRTLLTLLDKYGVTNCVSGSRPGGGISGSGEDLVELRAANRVVLGRRSWHARSVTLWDELTPEECVVMGNAVEEGYLSEVIGDFLGHAEQGGAVWVFGSDPDAIRAMIPRFAGVVLDMIKRDLVEIREPVDGVWDKAPPMDGAEIHEVLADASAWIWSEGEARRMVMLMTTERADALLRGDLSPSSPPSDEPHHADRL